MLIHGSRQAAFPHQDFPRSLRETLTRLVVLTLSVYSPPSTEDCDISIQHESTCSRERERFPSPVRTIRHSEKIHERTIRVHRGWESRYLRVAYWWGGHIGVATWPHVLMAFVGTVRAFTLDGYATSHWSDPCFFFSLNDHKSKFAYGQTNLYQSYRIFSESGIFWGPTIGNDSNLVSRGKV